MRSNHLSRNSQAKSYTNEHEKKNKETTTFYQFFKNLTDRLLEFSPKKNKTLKTRQISSRSYSLPFKIETRLFQPKQSAKSTKLTSQKKV